MDRKVLCGNASIVVKAQRNLRRRCKKKMSDVFYANCSSFYVFRGSKFPVLVLGSLELCVSILTLTCSTS